MRNIPLPKIQHDNNLSIIVPNDPVKNELMIGVKLLLFRVRHVDEDISKLNDYIVSDGYGLKVNIKKLADKCKRLDKDLHVLVHEEFRDGFSPCASLTTRDGVLLHTFKLQPLDSTNDNGVCACPVTLGNESEDNTAKEHTCVDDMNEREDPEHALNVCSKTHGLHFHSFAVCIH